ncbi:MAG: methyltransferase domain-containing protein, partial [Pseudomonadota bacterium]
DISQDMLFLARTNLYQAGITNCTMRHGDMYQLRFGDESFDTVSLDLVLSQAEEPDRVLREAARILRPDGNMLLLDSVQDEFHSEKGLTPARITEWCESVGLSCLRTQVIDIDNQATVLCLAQRRSTGKKE